MPLAALVVSRVGFHWEELFGAYREFQKAGWDIRLFAPGQGPVRKDPLSLRFTGPLSWAGLGISRSIAPQTLLGREIEERLLQVRPTSEMDTSRVDLLYIAGGHGCLFDVNRDPPLHARIAELYRQGKILAAVCHATSTFAFVRVDGATPVRGKELTGFPDLLDRVLAPAGGVAQEFLPIPFFNGRVLREAGARLSFWKRLSALWNVRQVCTDAPFVTGVGPKAAAQTARSAIRLYSRRNDK